MYICELSIGIFTSTKYCNLALLHKMNNNTVNLNVRSTPTLKVNCILAIIALICNEI